MVDFLCTPPCSRIDLTVTMETMDFFIVQLSLSLRTKILCISGVPMNDLAPMKNCPGGGGGCKVGQISSRGIGSISVLLPVSNTMDRARHSRYKQRFSLPFFCDRILK